MILSLLSLALGLLLLPAALWVALPALADLMAWLAGSQVRGKLPPPATRQEHLLILVPAHDEALLIERSVRSLLGQEYPRDLLTVAVVADNCTDDTAELARGAGALVLERTHATLRGKGHAIRWGLEQVQHLPWTAVIIIDADTVVKPDFTRELMRWAPLADKALQTYDTASNEFENWLTRLAGLLTRSRYEVALPLKVRAGLSCPMTGDGLLLGRNVLAQHPWEVRTITEGWEYYARLTLAGLRVEYAPTPVVYAQEARSLGQSGTQRERWASGRFEVLGMYRGAILAQAGLSPLQRVDLLAELSNPGPVVRGACATIGIVASLAAPPMLGLSLQTFFAMGVLQPVLYAALALRRHPEPGATIRAALHLPRYVLWRVAIALRAALRLGGKDWVRTSRTQEH